MSENGNGTTTELKAPDWLKGKPRDPVSATKCAHLIIQSVLQVAQQVVPPDQIPKDVILKIPPGVPMTVMRLTAPPQLAMMCTSPKMRDFVSGPAPPQIRDQIKGIVLTVSEICRLCPFWERPEDGPKPN